MSDSYTTLTIENLTSEHLCCAIADKKHQCGVDIKRAWLSERIPEGHVFRKLDAKGKIFIEYAPLETAWVPILGENYMYIYCLWVSGSYKGKGHAKALLEYCIDDAKLKGKSGICILSAKKKKPFLSEKTFLAHNGFQVVDAIDDYELLALSFDSTAPFFSDSAKNQVIENEHLTIYYGLQCPYIPHCIKEIKNFCTENQIPHTLIVVDSLEQAKELPFVFNNWAVFYEKQFKGVHLLNEGYLKKLLNITHLN